MYAVVRILHQVELGAAGGLEGIGQVTHAGRRQRAFFVPVQGSARRVAHLRRDGIFGPSFAVFVHQRRIFGERVSALNHESVNDAVEQEAVVVSGQRQFLKIVPVPGRVLVQFYPDGAQVGDNIKNGLRRKGFRRLLGGYGVGGFYREFFDRLDFFDPAFATGHQGQNERNIQILLHILSISFGKNS